MTVNGHEPAGRSAARRVIVLWAAVALAGGRAAAAQTSAPPASPRTPLARVLVVPFENVNREGRFFWMQEAAAVLLADDLNAMGVDAITREQRRQAFERLQVPPAAVLTNATIIRIGQLVGASHVMEGSIELSDSTLIVRARTVALDAGRVQASVVERAPMTDLFAMFERVARQLASRGPGESSEAAHPYPPLPAFEDYIKGLVTETPASAIGFLNSALKQQPSFDRARLALWDVYEEQGNYARALESVKAVPADSAWARRAQFMAGLSELNLSRFDEAIARFTALLDPRPTAAVLNDIGVALMRHGAAAQGPQPASYFRKAADADPDDPDYFFNLGYAYWIARDPQAAIYWLREAVRRNPADGDAHFVLSAALTSANSLPEAAREKELARRLSSTYEHWEKRPATEPVPKGLERVKSDVELPHARRIQTTLETSEHRDQQDLARFYLERARRQYQQEDDRDAAVELNKALYLAPYDAEAHLLLGRIHLRGGRIRDAIDAFKISLWSQETVAAHVALGEAYLQAKDLDSARQEADRALALDSASEDARRLAERIKPR